MLFFRRFDIFFEVTVEIQAVGLRRHNKIESAQNKKDK